MKPSVAWPVERPRKAEEDDPDSYWGSNSSIHSTFDSCLDTIETVQNEAGLNLEEVPFDRDVRWVNVASGARPRRTIAANNLFLKQVQSITASNVGELNDLDHHYISLDQKKKDFDSQFRQRRSRPRVEFNAPRTASNRGNASSESSKPAASGDHTSYNQSSHDQGPSLVEPEESTRARLGVDSKPYIPLADRLPPAPAPQAYTSASGSMPSVSSASAPSSRLRPTAAVFQPSWTLS